MRIAHVITRLILGGAQENTLLTCEGLRDRYGDEVLLITGPALGPEGSLIQRCRDHGVPLEIISDLRRAIHPVRDWKSFCQIRSLLARFQPDVVHTHSAKGGILGRAAAARLRVPAVVHTVHGAPFHPYQGKLARRSAIWAERWAARRCRALVSVSDAMTELMTSHGVAAREKFVTIRSGLEVEPLLTAGARREAVRHELGYGAEHIVVGKIARLFHLKGHEFLIRAAGRVVAAVPQVRFLLVGDGALHDRLAAEVAAAGLADHFRFFGLAPPDRIPELIAATDLVVHVSLREGLARVLPQALIVGRPAISYNIDGAREVVIDGETGYLLPPRSVDPLADAIIRLAADPELRTRFGAEGRRRFTDLFRQELMVDEIRQLYGRLLAGTPAQARPAPKV